VFEETLYAETLGMSGVASLADHLFVDEWWVTNIDRYPEIVATRREANRSHADIDRQRIALSLGCETAATLGHEAAHVAQSVLCAGQDVAIHGIEFRAAMVDVTSLLCGPIVAERLVRSYRGHGLEIGARQVDPPPVRHERGIYALWRLDRHTATG
jgi:hypothetical protein